MQAKLTIKAHAETRFVERSVVNFEILPAEIRKRHGILRAMRRNGSVVLGVLLAVACSPPATPSGARSAAKSPPAQPSAARAAESIDLHGSFSLDRLRLSPPILPCHLLLFPYREDAAEKAKLAYDVSLTFEFLSDYCKRRDPEIQSPTAAHGSLTLEQWRNNYEHVAKCAYDDFFAKPYWIPNLVDTVDVCRIVLGREWELPAVETLARLPKAEHAALVEALTTSRGLGSAYFSLRMYARDRSGRLVELDLAQGTTRPLLVTEPRWNVGTTALRCWRSTPTMTPTTTADESEAHERSTDHGKAPGEACRAALAKRVAKLQAARQARPSDADLTASEPTLHQLVRYAESVSSGETELDESAACRKLRAARPAIDRLDRDLRLGTDSKRSSRRRPPRQNDASARDTVKLHWEKVRMMEAVGRAYHKFAAAAQMRPKLEQCLRSLVKGR